MSPLLAMFSLVVALGANVAPGQLTWERDYRQARQLGERLQKPLAVFVGSGENGWDQLASEGKLDAAIQKTLVESYVRVYIDTASPKGRKLADAFGFTGKRGLVISDRTGDVQAFWHQGDLAVTDISGLLARYSAQDFVVRTTETQKTTAVQSSLGYVTPASYQEYFQPACRT